MKTPQNSDVFISIITITYNAESFLEDTIQSIIQQTCKDFEYIIIDGGSKDGTLDIIHKYEQYITRWTSEPDEGIYDAMNKGIKLANGKYLWFMNAGDTIYDQNTLNQIYQLQDSDADIFFGETMMYNSNQQQLGLRSEVTPLRLPQQLSWKSLHRGMVVCHQSFIAKRSLGILYDFKAHPFSGDIDWEIRCLKKSKLIIPTQSILSNYLLGGFSKQHLKASLIDRYKILQKHYGFWTNLINHLLIVIRFIGFKYLRSKKI